MHIECAYTKRKKSFLWSMHYIGYTKCKNDKTTSQQQRLEVTYIPLKKGDVWVAQTIVTEENGKITVD